MRQHIDHKHFYDRTKLTLKVIHKTQYVAAMNPTAGSFHIQDRLQRHFCTLALSFPDESAVQTIYTSILSQHFRSNGMPSSLNKMVGDLVNVAIAIHSKITSTFLPTAVCFHYVFNLRDLSNIFQVGSKRLYIYSEKFFFIKINWILNIPKSSSWLKKGNSAENQRCSFVNDKTVGESIFFLCFWFNFGTVCLIDP